MRPGDAYWIEDDVRGKVMKHLHVVLTHPEPTGEDRIIQVAVVNVSTVRNKRVQYAVTLRRADYPGFTEEQYYVAYDFANFEAVDDIVEKKGYANAVASFSPGVFDKIFQGMFKPNVDINHRVRSYCSARVGPNPGQVLNLSEGREVHSKDED